MSKHPEQTSHDLSWIEDVKNSNFGDIISAVTWALDSLGFPNDSTRSTVTALSPTEAREILAIATWAVNDNNSPVAMAA